MILSVSEQPESQDAIVGAPGVPYMVGRCKGYAYEFQRQPVEPCRRTIAVAVDDFNIHVAQLSPTETSPAKRAPAK